MHCETTHVSAVGGIELDMEKERCWRPDGSHTERVGFIRKNHRSAALAISVVWAFPATATFPKTTRADVGGIAMRCISTKRAAGSHLLRVC